MNKEKSEENQQQRQHSPYKVNRTPFYEYVAWSFVHRYLLVSLPVECGWMCALSRYTALALYGLHFLFLSFSVILFTLICVVLHDFCATYFFWKSLTHAHTLSRSHTLFLFFVLAKPLAYTFSFMLQSIASFLFKWSKYHLAIIGHKICIKEL